MTDPESKQVIFPSWIMDGLSLLLLVAGFKLRLDHLLARIFHIDEYISMLAAQMTAEKGAPIFPSGLLYDHGLLVSYMTAPLLRLLGFSEEIARWPAVLIGLLTVAVFYRVGATLFKSRAVGLLAMTFATLDVPTILWSARVRMYALAGLFMLLGLYFLVQGTLLNPKRRYRLVAVACYLGAILSHSVSVVILPVWGLMVAICVGVGRKRFRLDWYRQQGVWLEVSIVLVLVLLGAGFGVVRQVPFLTPDTDADDLGGNVLGVLSKFLEPGVSWERVDDFIYYYTSPVYWPLLVLGGLACASALASIVRGRFTRRDLITLCLGLAFWLVMAELGLALNHTWRKTRYLFVLCQAPFLFLAADGLKRLGGLAAAPFRNHSQLVAPAGSMLGVIAILVFWGGPALAVARAHGTGGYDVAFMWVRDRWQTGDRVMTVHPSAAFLYLGRSDYYATQGTARVLLDEDSEELVDRYVGSELVDSVDRLNELIAKGGRLWYVVDTNRLFGRYEPLFIQQVFAQMDIAYETGGVLVFLSRPYPIPVPVEPTSQLSADFGDLIELGGYSLPLERISPDGTVQLALYWRPQAVPLAKAYKVFVHLRDGHGHTVAQADHYIYEGMLTNSVIKQLRDQGEWLRDTADLMLPQQLPAGTYHLLVGLYDPETFERVRVVADQSGENAVLLETVSVP